VITATDGDNGGWFRNTTHGANFWGAFYQPMLDRIRAGDDRLRPTLITHYLDEFGAEGRVRVNTGAWNTGWHHGKGFVQWTGSDRQKEALARVAEVSARYWNEHAKADDARRAWLEQAYYRILRAETSCNFFWGEAWVDRAHQDLDQALAHL